MKKNDKLHEEAQLRRSSADDECRSYNEEAEMAAVAEFEEGKEAKYFRENADYVTGLVVKRLEAAKKGEKTFPLRPYDAETLARLLSICTEAPYDAMEYDEDLSDEETIEAYENGDLVHDGCPTSAETPATSSQKYLCYALHDYATAAAVYAKHIGSSSLLEWAEMIDILDERLKWFFPALSSNQAMRVIELEKSAANRLRLDKVISELPRFTVKAAKKAKR